MSPLKDSMGYTVLNGAHIVEHDGDAWFAGDVYVGPKENTKKLATEEYVNASSGGDGVLPLVITITGTGTGYESSHTANDIAEAVSSGRKVSALYRDTTHFHVYSDAAEKMFGFSTVTALGSCAILIGPNSVEVAENEFVKRPEVAEVGQILVVKEVDQNFSPSVWECVDPSDIFPSVTTADNGKILKVVNGAWAAVNP